MKRIQFLKSLAVLAATPFISSISNGEPITNEKDLPLTHERLLRYGYIFGWAIPSTIANTGEKGTSSLYKKGDFKLLYYNSEDYPCYIQVSYKNCTSTFETNTIQKNIDMGDLFRLEKSITVFFQSKNKQHGS